jgi:hypothetical protein
MDVHLPHRLLRGDLYRGFGDAYIAGNLLAKATPSDVNHDFALPGAQRAKTLPEVGQSILILAPNRSRNLRPKPVIRRG